MLKTRNEAKDRTINCSDDWVMFLGITQGPLLVGWLAGALLELTFDGKREGG